MISFPEIKRSRDYYLYDFSGNRYLDLYQNGGRAIMGHKPQGLSTVLKNTISKGLLSEYPGVYYKRLLKILKIFFPEYEEYRVFSSMDKVVMVLSDYLQRSVTSIPDPVVTDSENQNISLWRPFLKPSKGKKPDILVPVLPFPLGGTPGLVCLKKTSGAEKIPPSDVVSPFMLAGIIKSLNILLKFKNIYTEEIWCRFNSSLWDRKGPYLIMRCNREEYGDIFDRFKRRKILLSPFFPGPSIVPLIFSEGDIKFIKKEG